MSKVDFYFTKTLAISPVVGTELPVYGLVSSHLVVCRTGLFWDGVNLKGQTTSLHLSMLYYMEH